MKKWSSPPSIFLKIKKYIFLKSELHPHIGEICTDILVYEKGGVIKHIKAPARIELPHDDVE